MKAGRAVRRPKSPIFGVKSSDPENDLPRVLKAFAAKAFRQAGVG